MPIEQPSPELKIWQARIVAVNTTDRLVSVKFLGSDRGADNVIVVMPPGNYSFPKKDDVGLVIFSDEQRYFYIGTIQFGYRDKLVRDKVKDRSTGIGYFAKEVLEGEIHLSNMLKRVWLRMASSGDFSLLNGRGEGLKYHKQYRLTKLIGMAINILGNGSRFILGSVMRDIPTTGKQVIGEPSGSLTPALEALIELVIEPLKTRLARFHIGHVTDTTLGTPTEMSSWGAKLRAILEVCNPAGVSSAALKMDETGNAELISTLANVMLDGLFVQLGGVTAAEPVIKGLNYTSAESTFLTALQVFCAAVGAAGGAGGTPVQNAAALQAIGVAANTLQAAVTSFSSALAGALSNKVMTA